MLIIKHAFVYVGTALQNSRGCREWEAMLAVIFYIIIRLVYDIFLRNDYQNFDIY